MRPLIIFEPRSRPLASRRVFFRRLARGSLAGGALVAVSLAGGMAGYHYLEHLPWLDAFANASMILSGMGPLANPQTPGGKLFAGCYALYSGLVVIIVAGVIFAPVIHRIMHKFHAEDAAAVLGADEDDRARPAPRKSRRQTKPR